MRARAKCCQNEVDSAAVIRYFAQNELPKHGYSQVTDWRWHEQKTGMKSSALVRSPTAVSVEVSDDALSVSLSDGRVVAVPISWFPRLSHASPRHRAVWKFVGGGHGIHWPELDEDISVENLLAGQPSGEGAKSFAKWKEWYQHRENEKGSH